MDTFRIAALLGTLFALALVGCETQTCRSACSKIFVECGFSPSGCETATSGIDCSNPDEVATHYRDVCTDRCEEALYNIDETEGDTTLYNEEDAVQFIDCVVSSGCPGEGGEAYKCQTSFSST